ncbi:MAG: hypothetical protein ABL898_16595 [Hyphomicrobiaceae bacterium]|nr:hypothetical protein [Hyphomicrobiaceae bacterium]
MTIDQLLRALNALQQNRGLVGDNSAPGLLGAFANLLSEKRNMKVETFAKELLKAYAPKKAKLKTGTRVKAERPKRINAAKPTS